MVVNKQKINGCATPKIKFKNVIGRPSKACRSPARYTAAGKLCLRLLDADFLEVDEACLVDVQHEAATVGAHRIAADGRLSIKRDDSCQSPPATTRN